MDLNYQYAHNSHDESETKNGVSTAEALNAFEVFDWAGETEKANTLQKCSPTLSVITAPDIEFIWVSAYTESNSIQFVSECNFPGEVSSWFGLSKKQGIVNLHTQSFSAKQAKAAVEFFVARDYNSLRKLY